MKASDYFAHPAYSASDLLMFMRSPQLLADHRAGLVRRAESAAMSIGTAIHAALLEPQRLLVQPDSYDGKPWHNGATLCKEWHAEAKRQDAAVITTRLESELAIIQARMPDEVRRIIEACEKEQSIFAKFKGLDLKCRADLINRKHRIIYDLKTIADIDNIEKNIYAYKYHLRAEWYKLVCDAADNGAPYSFTMIFVESAPPYRWKIVQLSPTYEYDAKRQVYAAFPMLKHCHITNNFRDDGDLYETVESPSWMELDEEGDDDAL